MLAKVYSCAVVGLEGALIEVEVDTTHGLPSFVVVGLPDTAVQESRERVQAAIRNAGYWFPQKRVTVNLAPAALRKEGPAYDLPIALGVLVAMGQLQPESFDKALVMGELSLDGSVRHVRGVLPMTALARAEGYHTVLVPADDAREAALAPGVSAIPVSSLRQLVAHLNGAEPIAPTVVDARVSAAPAYVATDFAKTKGTTGTRRIDRERAPDSQQDWRAVHPQQGMDIYGEGSGYHLT